MDIGAFFFGAASNAVGTLMADGVELPLGYLPHLFGDKKGQSDPLPLPDLEFSENKELVASKSYTCAFDEIMVALKDDEVNTIGVWGLGGVGKTTLVTQVGYTAKSLQLFHKVIKVVVSRTPDIGKIQQKIADFLHLEFTKTTKEGKAEELWLRLEKEEKVLIVLDDMWSPLSLKDIGLPFDETRKGCKIILTTRRRQVCEFMKSQVTVSLGVLEEDEAWVLFKMNASLENASPDIIKEAKKVAEECGGLPIAIVTLASALRSKGINGWELARLKLERSRSYVKEFPVEVENNVYRCLETSYNYLERPETKRCFLLCGLYPEDYSINAEDLVICAWGLRLYQNAESIQEVRMEVFEAIENLKSCCLLLGADEEAGDERFLLEDKERYVKVHDVVRDVARWLASKEDIGFLTKPGVDSFKEKLEILILDNFEGMQNLRVLSLENDQSDHSFLSLNALDSLTNLQALQLKYFLELEGISALAKLTKLEILSLVGAQFHDESIEELGELKNLRLLDLSFCAFFLAFPSNLIRRLVKLEELYIYTSKIEMSDIITVILPELNILSKLASLSLKVPSLEFSEDSKFPRLERYIIAINAETRGDWEAISSRSLRISGGLPFKVISELLWNVEYLEVSTMMNENIECLIDTTTTGSVPVATILQNLRVVRIEKCEYLQGIFQPNMANSQEQLLLSKLKVLHLIKLPLLRFIWKMPTEHIRLQSLEDVRICGCDKLEFLFSFSLAQSLVCLENLVIGGCDKLKQIVEEPEGNDKSPICFRKLRYLEIFRCNDLEYVFPNFAALLLLEMLSLTDLLQLKQICNPERQREEHGIWLPQLQHLELTGCPKFAGTIHSKPESANLELPHGYNVMSSLKTMMLSGLLLLQDICKGPIQVQVTNLRELKVYSCNRLTHIFPVMLARNLQQLSTLRICWCEKLEQIIVNDHDMSASSSQGRGENETGKENDKGVLMFPRLEQLCLLNLPNLKSFSPEGYHLVFPSLDSIYIYNCSRLTKNFIFNSRLSVHAKQKLLGGSNNMSSLKTMTLGYLIWQHIWKGPIQVALTNLGELKLYGCEGLTYIFSVMIARNLPQLRILKIEGCEKVEQIIVDDDLPSSSAQGNGDDDETGVKDQKERRLKFPQLQELSLERLRNLKSFSPVGCHLLFPSLSQLLITNCYQMFTSFTVDSELRVHAETKKNQLRDVDNCPTQYVSLSNLK